MENIDISGVAAWSRKEGDTGSPEYQVARLSARVKQLSTHIKINKKDHASKRGLLAILAQRKKLLQYLYTRDRER
jgi:small subunit ribosomal protein S15